MNKFGILSVMFALLLVGAVSATTTTLSDDELSMAYTDVRIVEFCISNKGVPMDVDVAVDPVCLDQNGLYGCQTGEDIFDPAGFTVVPNEATTGADGCVDLTLTTNIANPEDAGLFYYTVNGMIGDATIGSETGEVLVPEFGVLAAGLALSGAALFIWRRRQ